MKRRKWNISDNSRIYKITSPANKMNLLVQAPHEEESKEYFTLLQSPNCNKDGRLESNREDQYTHNKLLQNRNWDVIDNLKE
jgi:hypothetical protein